MVNKQADWRNMCPGMHKTLNAPEDRCEKCAATFFLSPFGWIIVPDPGE